MFLKKNQEIAHLKEVIRLKEAERRTAWTAANEDKKRLSEALREKAKAQNRVREMERREKFNEDCIAVLHEMNRAKVAEAAKRERQHRERMQKVHKACAKMRAVIKEQAERIALLENNMEALGATIINMENECGDRYMNELALRSKLEVYERIIGKMEEENGDDRVSAEAVPCEPSPEIPAGESDGAPSGRELCDGGGDSAPVETEQQGTAAAGTADGGAGEPDGSD